MPSNTAGHMDVPVVWLYWIISLTIVTYASAYIIRRHREYGYAALVGFYVVYLAASQIVAFDIGSGGTRENRRGSGPDISPHFFVRHMPPPL